MVEKVSERAARARAASADELRYFLHEENEEVLAAMLENPHLDEPHLHILLERKNLSGAFIEEIARQKSWMRSYQMKLRVARHPHAPRLVAIPLLRQLHLFDLVNVSLLPSVPGEIRRLAEDMLIGRLPQIPLGQRFTLARRGSSRVAGALLAEGHDKVVPIALDNAFLEEAELLKVLARDGLPAHVVAGVAQHRKWSYLYPVRMALVRHPLTPLSRVLAFLPDLALRDLAELSTVRTLSENLRTYIGHEIARRSAPRRRIPREE